MDYGKAIKIVRTLRGLSLLDLSKKIKPKKLDSSYLSRIEKGERTPSLKTLENIANALEIPSNVVLLLANNKKLTSKDNKTVKEIGELLFKILKENKL
jgi:transcriptional regulator with XRE-family HTH domain